ncbi:DUF3422 family protein [Bradyrhizobium guangzhouense]|nr:DUF3422 domain-containing protein [Bradyrhizobium guangzhouense]RXH09363.1 DUF3422 domain-containing protein [Bradyrhizobium guangzhouense]
MHNGVMIGSGDDGLKPHPWRTIVLGEVHARPFNPLTTPLRLLHFAFDTGGERAAADRDQLAAFCQSRGLPPPSQRDKHFRVSLGGAELRWEQHSEFTTYTWELPGDSRSGVFHPPASSIAAPMRAVRQPGPVLVAVDLHVMKDRGDTDILSQVFDTSSLAAAETLDDYALYATDFKVNAEGFLRILVLNRSMSPEQTGSTVQHLLDIETYRTLALLGLPEAQRLSPSISRAEHRLAEVTARMSRAKDLNDNSQMLDELTLLAADVEAGAAASLFRFGASRAYEEIVTQRLQILGERKLAGFPTWSSFLARRMTPAMRTCMSTSARQSDLSLRLARAANLLRTRVDVELEHQNQQLLKSMNARTRLQLQLQTTVEGLSVAAITYYITGLLSYLAKAGYEGGWIKLDPNVAVAGLIPVVALAI